ncbi:MAG: biotin--[acetyl-CoA-carboxylase] ligase [Lachnospiraceae bacterium]|nr:biotin--[acetyl-CoA-carboxylase] ligase [Lachnospiraceae bacterium]
MKTKILQVLRQNQDSYVSGQELCGELGVSRTAVWKYIKQLKEAGYEIAAVQNRGYRLVSVPDILSQSEVASRLHTKWLGHDVRYYDELDSTNMEAKRIAEEAGNDGWHGTVVVADKQTAGRGRRGRTWSSPVGTGLFFSVLLKPEIDPGNASMLTLVKGMAAVKGIAEVTGLSPQIKWPNDIVIHGKKIVGILTEMSAQIDYVNHIVVGTGINVHQTEFPEEIAGKASSLRLEMQAEGKEESISRAQLLGAVLKYFEQYYEIYLQTEDLSALKEEYQTMLVNCGRTVRVLDPLGEYEGKAMGIDCRGELLVERDGEVCRVSAGEVSVRGIYGYV